MEQDRASRRPDRQVAGALQRGTRRGLVTTMALIVGMLAAPVGAGANEQPLGGVVYDVDAAPDGSFLVAENTSVKEVRKGQVSLVADLPTAEGEGPIGVPATAPVNGLAVIGRGNFFATTGGVDLGQGAGLWRVSRGNARQVADIEAFELANDPDATQGEQWKHPLCEEAEGYTAGPQSNPYHLTVLSGSEVLVADAAGNSLLWAKTNGEVDWVAVFPPAYDDAGNWLLQQTYQGIDCYVQPVPTAVDVGPDGAYYVGELSGTPADPGDLVGVARVWRIEAGARNVVCPSEACAIVVDGLTSVVDVEFGPDGRLYVLELDVNGWLAAVVPELKLGGGRIQACAVATGDCDIVTDDLVTPAAITFDKQGDLWVLDNMFSEPEILAVRRVLPAEVGLD